MSSPDRRISASSASKADPCLSYIKISVFYNKSSEVKKAMNMGIVYRRKSKKAQPPKSYSPVGCSGIYHRVHIRLEEK
jgi:hypothetical protein